MAEFSSSTENAAGPYAEPVETSRPYFLKIYFNVIVNMYAMPCIATCYELDDLGVGVRVPVRSSYHPDWLWGHPASYPMGAGTFSRGVKRQGREADHSPPSSAEVKKTWIYTSTPPYVYMVHGVVLS
jgi:hypothetical protein